MRCCAPSSHSRRDLDAPPRPLRRRDPAVDHLEGRCEEAVLPRVVVRALDRVLDVGAGVGHSREEVEREHRHERQVGRVRDARQAGVGRHPGDGQGAREAADVADVGLHDVDRAPVDHVPPAREQAVLLAAGDVEVERLRHLGRPLELPVRAGLLEVDHAMLLEEPPDFDRLRRRVAAVRIDQEPRIGADRGPHSRNDSLCPAGPLVLVVPALPPDADLERGEAVAVSQLGETPRLVSRRDVAAHARRVRVDRAGGRSQELAHSHALQAAAQVPERRIDPGQRPADI